MGEKSQKNLPKSAQSLIFCLNEVHYNQRMRLAGFVLVLQLIVNLMIPAFALNSNTAMNLSITKSAPLSQSELNWVSAPQWILDLKPWLTLPTDEPILLQAIKQGIAARENAEQYADAIELIKAGLVLFPTDAFFPYRMGMIFAIFQPEQAQQYLSLAAINDQGLRQILNLFLNP